MVGLASIINVKLIATFNIGTAICGIIMNALGMICTKWINNNLEE